MKKVISVLLSVLLILSSLSAFAADNITDVTDGTVNLFKNYLNSNTVELDDNYFFIGELAKSSSFSDGSYVFKFSTDFESNTDKLEVAFGVKTGEAFSTVLGADMTNQVGGQLFSTKMVKDTPAIIMGMGMLSHIIPSQIGVSIMNSEKITDDVNITVEICEATPVYGEGESSQTVIDVEIGDVVSSVMHTFKAPIVFANDKYKAIGQVLTSLRDGGDVETSDVVSAMKDMGDATNVTEADRIKLSEALTDEVLTKLSKLIVDNYSNITVNEKVDGVAMPYSALALVPSDASVAFAPIIGVASENYDVEVTDTKAKKKAMNISLGATVDGNTLEVSVPLMKQKVVVDIPTEWDLTGNEPVSVYHGQTKLNVTVDKNNKTVSFFVESFSDFMLVGTEADETTGTRTNQVKYLIEQVDPENAPEKFALSIVPTDNNQIIRFANAPMKILFKDDGIDESEAMKNLSIKIDAATGIEFVERKDIEKDETKSVIGGIEFVAKIADNDNLLTVAPNTSLKIADIEVTGNGKFYVYTDAIYSDDRNIYMESLDSNQAETAQVRTGTYGAFEIPEKELELKLNLDFGKNVIVSEDAEYIDMTITLKGLNSKKEYTVKVGTITAEDEAAGVEGLKLYTVDGICTAKGSIMLPANDSYDFVITGVGYRDFRGSVLLDEVKTINLWTYAATTNLNGIETPKYNAVISTATGDEDTIMKDKTFLVGDIYMDNIVDVYDLSAVLSYYGKTDIQTGEKYVAHDLNRDGKINSADLAYVQVSYGN